MCTRGTVPQTEEKCPHVSPPQSSPTTSIHKESDIGPYGPYNEPLLPPSEDMKNIVGDMISMYGGVAAVLLQIAQPAVGAGVAANSSFTTRPIERGRRSMIYIFVQAFGTPEEKRYITDATHKSHAKIKGTLGDTYYDANDVDLQLWVAATTYWSLIESWEIAYGVLPPDRRERVYKEFSSMATALHVPASKWPKDLAAFDEYWNHMISTLKVSPEVRAVGRQVLYPAKDLFAWKTLHVWLYIILNGPINRVVTTEMLPEPIRNAYGIPSTVRTRAIYKIGTAVTRAVWPLYPKFMKTPFKDFYMKDMRDRIQKGKRW